LCYTAYDGQNPPKIALTSISVSDFVHQIWDFKKPVVISDPTLDNKDGCLFPELIDGKYVFLHREGGKGIMIDYVDNLEFANNTHLERDAFFYLVKMYGSTKKLESLPLLSKPKKVGCFCIMVSVNKIKFIVLVLCC